MKCEHAIQCCGAKVRICDDKVNVLTEPHVLEAIIFSVCNTCTSMSDMKHVANADIVTASASALIRKHIGPKALMQLGVTIPVFALTDEGKKTMLAYLSRFDQKIVAFRAHLPYIVETRGPMLRV